MTRIACIVVTVTLVLLPRAGAAQLPGAEEAARSEAADFAAAPGRIMVKYKAGVGAAMRAGVSGTSLDDVHAALGVRRVRPLVRNAERTAALMAPMRRSRGGGDTAPPDLSRLYLVEFDADVAPLAAAAALASNPAVEYAQPDYEVRLAFIPDDPFYSSSGTWNQSYEDLWGLHLTDAATAWDIADGSGVVIAVIDTGVDYDHPDLAASMWTNQGEVPGNGFDDDRNGFVDDVSGWDFGDGDADPMDDNGHGTHVAGTAAAVGNNGIGVIGMAWGARIMALKIFDKNGIGWQSDAIAAVDYAARNGADVINASYIGPGFEYGAERDAVDAAHAMGTLMVAAAGNGHAWNGRRSPANIPGVVTVAAIEPDGDIAGFSSYGEANNVSAPGSDILSTRSPGPVDGYGQKVGSDYLRLSGTSMATPHVSGLVALLMAADPSLTLDEIRWRLELNAVQPGYPGWEGLAWNPYHGWGRIDAGSVFNVPPVTTRLGLDGIAIHGFAGAVRPDFTFLDLTITTAASTPWTASAPAWLAPSVFAGTTSARLDLSLDATGVAPGAYSDTLRIGVPGAVDGGGEIPVTAHVHADLRAGPEISVSLHRDVMNFTSPGAPAIASNGLTTLVAYDKWERSTGKNQVIAHLIDSAGIVSPPILVREDWTSVHDVVAGSDGQGYLIAWVEWLEKRDRIEVVRLTGSGEIIDHPPIVLEDRRIHCCDLLTPKIAYDGVSYVVLWQLWRGKGAHHYIRRISPTGQMNRKPVKILNWKRGDPSAGIRIACIEGECMITGIAYQSYPEPDELRAVRLVGEKLVGKTGSVVLVDVNTSNALVSDGANYFATAKRWEWCSSPCQDQLFGVRITRYGVPLDPAGIDLDREEEGLEFSRSMRAAGFDGTHYLAIQMLQDLVPGTILDFETTLFLTRIDPQTGAVVDTESRGLLVSADGRSLQGPVIARTATRTMLAYHDNSLDDSHDGWQEHGATKAQPMLARAAGPEYAAAPIGSIGDRNVGEGERLALALSAAGLDHASVRFSATGAPPAAIIDAASGLFAWKPDGDDAGTAASVTFTADDGTTSVSETVTLTVDERILSIGGTVELADGSPVAGVHLDVRGIPKRRIVVVSDALGRFLVEGVVPDRKYKLKVSRASRKQFRGARVKLDVGSADVSDAVLVVTPK